MNPLQNELKGVSGEEKGGKTSGGTSYYNSRTEYNDVQFVSSFKCKNDDETYFESVLGAITALLALILKILHSLCSVPVRFTVSSTAKCCVLDCYVLGRMERARNPSLFQPVNVHWLFKDGFQCYICTTEIRYKHCLAAFNWPENKLYQCYIGFYVDVTASDAGFAAILPAVCWHFCASFHFLFFSFCFL